MNLRKLRARYGLSSLGGRTSKADLVGLADRLNEAEVRKGFEGGYYIQWAYGRPRLERELKADHVKGHPKKGHHEISPRMQSGELRAWMEKHYAEELR